MSFTLLINIKKLLQVRESNLQYVSGKDMNIIPSINDAYLLLENSFIKDFGEMKDCPKKTCLAPGVLFLVCDIK